MTYIAQTPFRSWTDVREKCKKICLVTIRLVKFNEWKWNKPTTTHQDVIETKISQKENSNNIKLLPFFICSRFVHFFFFFFQKKKSEIPERNFSFRTIVQSLQSKRISGECCWFDTRRNYYLSAEKKYFVVVRVFLQQQQIIIKWYFKIQYLMRQSLSKCIQQVVYGFAPGYISPQKTDSKQWNRKHSYQIIRIYLRK